MNTAPILEAPRMGRKRGERRTVLARVYDDFLETVKQAAGERRLTVAEFLDLHALPCVRKAHADYIKAESKKLGGGSE